MKQTSSKTVRARALRRNTTEAETQLWSALRARQLGGFKFRRQRPLGSSYPDFVCLEQRLIVEVDGGQHAGSKNDVARTIMLNDRGYRVVRFWNSDVLGNLDGVLLEILRVLRT